MLETTDFLVFIWKNEILVVPKGLKPTYFVNGRDLSSKINL